MSITEQVDVAIVGSGPAGLAAAIELRRQGVARVCVLERDGEAGGIPRHCAHPPFGLREHGRLLTGPATRCVTSNRLNGPGWISACAIAWSLSPPPVCCNWPPRRPAQSARDTRAAGHRRTRDAALGAPAGRRPATGRDQYRRAASLSLSARPEAVRTAADRRHRVGQPVRRDELPACRHPPGGHARTQRTGHRALAAIVVSQAVRSADALLQRAAGDRRPRPGRGGAGTPGRRAGRTDRLRRHPPQRTLRSRIEPGPPQPPGTGPGQRRPAHRSVRPLLRPRLFRRRQPAPADRDRRLVVPRGTKDSRPAGRRPAGRTAGRRARYRHRLQRSARCACRSGCWTIRHPAWRIYSYA